MGDGEQIRVSVVIPAYRGWDTIVAVLDALAPQVVRPDREAVLVESSGGTGAADLARDYPWLQVVALPERCLPGRARNIGARRARGDLLVFLDADAIPERGWLDALEGSLVPGKDAVAGAIVNGTPWHPIGTAGYLLEFSDWMPRRRGQPGHAASANLLVRRTALDAAGGFAENLFPGEDTLLTFPLATQGRLAFAPGARVRHMNRTSVREFLRHQHRLGAAFASVCRRTDFPHRRFARPPLSVLAPGLRVAAVFRRVARSPTEAAQALAFLPFTIPGSVAWALGMGERGVVAAPIVAPIVPGNAGMTGG